jgi:hypothetical protein|tara:strand:+ start:2969 stop:3484 length:516 start_codon:yes stop_codon:yes gene_type:complete
MTLLEFKEILTQHKDSPNPILFNLDNGGLVPPYFHITEMGLKTKHFVDCGGTLRSEQNITFQIWTADDFNHRITPTKLLSIIDSALTLPYFQKLNGDIEMEYQNQTIGLYGVEHIGMLSFNLTPKKTNCLAPDKCGINTESNKPKTFLSGYDMENVRKNTTKPTQCGPSCC